MRSILSSIVLLLAVVDFTQAAPLEERAPRSFRWSIKSFGGTVDVCLTADGFFNGAPVMVWVSTATVSLPPLTPGETATLSTRT